jgi:hypothetical protein
MPRVGFEPTIPAFKRAKTVHALDRLRPLDYRDQHGEEQGYKNLKERDTTWKTKA